MLASTLRHDADHAQADSGEALAVIGGVERKIPFVETDPPHKPAVSCILGDGTRQRTRVFSELQPHYLFADRFGQPNGCRL